MVLERHSKLTAIVCGNDYLAIGALAACRATGRAVPQDVSVTGLNDGELARYTWPPLTTVHLPMWEIGERAARYLIARLDGLDAPPPGDLPVSLRVRGSTAVASPQPRRGGRAG
ncbi:MAG: substrate-binding domain-containing protein [Burkholderiaceae bacterium]